MIIHFVMAADFSYATAIRLLLTVLHSFPAVLKLLLCSVPSRNFIKRKPSAKKQILSQSANKSRRIVNCTVFPTPFLKQLTFNFDFAAVGIFSTRDYHPDSYQKQGDRLMVILTLNCGSSSAKYQVYDWDNKDVLCVGVVERIGEEISTIEHKTRGKEDYEAEFKSPTHAEAIDYILKMLQDKEYGCIKSLDEIGAVGHRVLHGGEMFKKSTLVTDEVIEKLKTLIPLGPLHMPGNIMGIECARRLMPSVPQAIVLDTAWHQTMPPEGYMYAVPYEWYEKYNVRRYGFHGTSHLYCAKRAAVLLGKENKDTNVIILHVGNGASACAVKNGVCIDTSMGLTPLEGLVMGTRSGDIDPAVIPYICNNAGYTVQQMDTILNKKSGLVGLCGKADRRDVSQMAKNGDKKAQL